MVGVGSGCGRFVVRRRDGSSKNRRWSASAVKPARKNRFSKTSNCKTVGSGGKLRRRPKTPIYCSFGAVKMERAREIGGRCLSSARQVVLWCRGPESNRYDLAVTTV